MNLGKRGERALSVLFKKFPLFMRVWERSARVLTFGDTYWAEPPEDIRNVKIALVTTGGVHLAGDDPFDMRDKDGDPSFREIPTSAHLSDLAITHDYYDARDARVDPGIVFPLDVINDMSRIGEVGEVSHRHFSFMGHVKGRHLKTLIEGTAPEVAARLEEDGVGAVLLTPAWGLCNQTVGLVQREIEKRGIPTISVTLSESISNKVKPPRAVDFGFPLGHPLGFPNQKFLQRRLIQILLDRLSSMKVPGTVEKIPVCEDERDECAVCKDIE